MAMQVGLVSAPSSIFYRAGALTLFSCWLAPRARAASPEGQLTWGVAISLAPTWFDPAETPGIITPFVVMYALHLRVSLARGREVPQRRRSDR